MGVYTSYDYAAMVVAVSVLLVCKIIIIVTTNIVVKSFDFLINQNCSQYMTGEQASDATLLGIMKSLRLVLTNGTETTTPIDTLLELIANLNLTVENCKDVFKPLLRALLAWDVMICVLWLFCVFMIIGIITKSSCPIIPFFVWLFLTIMFAIAGVIAFVIKASLSANNAGIILVCTIIFVILLFYYCVVTYMQLQAASKANRTTVPNSEVVQMKSSFNYDRHY